MDSGRYQEASTLLGNAEERAPSDAEIRYYRGIAETALDHPADARIELEAAHNSLSFQAAAGLLLAELMARQQRCRRRAQTSSSILSSFFRCQFPAPGSSMHRGDRRPRSSHR